MLGRDAESIELPRLIVRDLGWQVRVKSDSLREFCHGLHPGEETYHRLAEGELYLQRAEEHYCLPCAGRLGLLRHSPTVLRDPVGPVASGDEATMETYELRPLDR